MTDVNTRITKIFKCQCHTEGYELCVVSEDGEIYMSLWNLGSNPRTLSWYQKFRYIWCLLRTGEPFLDQICFDKNTALELSYELRAIADSLGKV